MKVLLKKIFDNLYFFDMRSKIVLYVQSRKGILIDAGNEPRAAHKVHKKLQELGITPEVLIITHAHADHFGGASEFKKIYPNIKILASAFEKPVLEKPEYQPFYLYGAQPIPALRNKFLLGQSIGIDQVVTPETKIVLLGEEWTVLDLSGHTPGQIGLITPNKVVLTADALFTNSVREKYRLLYHFNIGAALKSLQRLEELLDRDYFCFIPTHGMPIDTAKKVIWNNRRAINENIELIQTILQKPHTREEVVAKVIQRLQIQETITQYFLTFSAVSAYISYLKERRVIITRLEAGNLYFLPRVQRENEKISE